MTITKVGSKTAKPVQSIAATGTKTKAKAKSETEAAVEELIDLHTKLTEADAFPMLKRLEELKKMLQQVMRDSGADPNTPYVFKTWDGGSVEFSACSKTLEIKDREAMIKALTLSVFKEIAKVSTTDLKTYLSLQEIASFTESVPGSRSMKSVKPAE